MAAVEAAAAGVLAAAPLTARAEDADSLARIARDGLGRAVHAQRHVARGQEKPSSAIYQPDPRPVAAGRSPRRGPRRASPNLSRQARRKRSRLPRATSPRRTWPMGIVDKTGRPAGLRQARRRDRRCAGAASPRAISTAIKLGRLSSPRSPLPDRRRRDRRDHRRRRDRRRQGRPPGQAGTGDTISAA